LGQTTAAWGLPIKTYQRWHGVPRGIWALGFVSLFMDISSEMIHALLPAYLVTALGASTLTVGILEGVAEATASLTKVFSGALSDWLGQRKLLAIIGYGLAALTKPVFPLAPSVDWLFAARFIDRIGKGIRGAPRDALVADMAPPHLRGECFGLRQSLDTFGAFLGPLMAIGLMLLTANHFQAVFWVAVIPAVLSVALIVIGVHEPQRSPELRQVRLPLHPDEFRHLHASYWKAVAIAALFSLARFSEAFLILRAQSVDLPLALVPLVLVIMNSVYSLSAYPIGILADRIDRTAILGGGLVVLVLADCVLAFAKNILGVTLGVALWGLHMGFTQGVLAAIIAEVTPAELRGTAFGIFNLVTGTASLAASVIAGALWDSMGLKATFLCGAGFAVLTIVSVLTLRGRMGERCSFSKE